MKLEKVVKSDAKGKKWTAIFCMCKGTSCCKDGDKKKVHFGAESYTDYTLGATEEQRCDAGSSMNSSSGNTFFI